MTSPFNRSGFQIELDQLVKKYELDDVEILGILENYKYLRLRDTYLNMPKRSDMVAKPEKK